MTRIPALFSDKIPRRLSKLEELAYDLQWSWNRKSRELWRDLDLPLWRQTNHNPVHMLHLISKERLEEVSKNPSFLLLYDSVIHDLKSTKTNNSLWFSKSYPQYKNEIIAYLSMEFAVHHSLPIYSGGLGVLSGDHCKEASDLGLSFVSVGFMYSQGYFTQSISPEGRQQASYETINFDETALHPVFKGKEDDDFLVSVPLGDRIITVKVWHLQIGKTDLFLMDTDLEQNQPEDRELSYRLYDTDRDLRLRQEIVAGMGSVRVLRALDIHPSVWHLNEGHSSFALVELIREKVAEGYVFADAKDFVKKHSAFTTHTPIPAGHEEFDVFLIEKYFKPVWKELGISKQEFLQLGMYEKSDGRFSMTMLATNLTSVINGVSQLNAKVMNKQLKPIWSKVYSEPPIIGITNGVHIPTWIAGRFDNVFNRYIGTDWMDTQDDPIIWERIYDIPDRILWDIRRHLKNKLINYIRDRARHKWRKSKLSAEQTLSSGVLLNPDTLTIGFARRLAPYKRATLIFKDIERLKSIVNNPYRPVQIIFAGKSHPANYAGMDMIQEIYKHTLNREFSGRIVFLEDYGINVARFLTQGVDIWLNTPRRPLEASGTSGQKAAINGVPNFSVLDGWWEEGYNGKNGWTIGSSDKSFDNHEEQDKFDVNSLYNVLETEIIPLYYNRDNEGIPRNWLDVVRESIKSTISYFSTRRMLKEYITRVYNPLQEENRN